MEVCVTPPQVNTPTLPKTSEKGPKPPKLTMLALGSRSMAVRTEMGRNGKETACVPGAVSVEGGGDLILRYGRRGRCGPLGGAQALTGTKEFAVSVPQNGPFGPRPGKGHGPFTNTPIRVSRQANKHARRASKGDGPQGFYRQ